MDFLLTDTFRAQISLIIWTVQIPLPISWPFLVVVIIALSIILLEVVILSKHGSGRKKSSRAMKKSRVRLCPTPNWASRMVWVEVVVVARPNSWARRPRSRWSRHACRQTRMHSDTHADRASPINDGVLGLCQPFVLIHTPFLLHTVSTFTSRREIATAINTLRSIFARRFNSGY